MTRFVSLILLFVCCGTLHAQQKTVVITSRAAVADGITNNATVIQKIIDQLSRSGGGTVVIPPGNFSTGTLFLKSNVTLHLRQGAVLLGSHSTNDYSKAGRRPALVIADKQKNVTVSGPGTIDGQGQELMLDIFKKLRSGQLENDSSWLYKRPEAGRAMVLYFKECTNVKVTDVTLKNASNWVQDYKECDGVIIDKIKVQSTAYWNNDGIDITDSRNVRVTNCFVNSSDDALCFKSENPSKICENVVVDNCILRSSASGLKFGTASHGGFRNFKVTNLQVFDTYRSAIAIECVDGGLVENIDIRNVTAKNTGNAIFIRRGFRNQNVKVGTIRNIYIANVKAQIPLLKPDQGYPIEGPPDHLRPGYDKMPVRPGSFHIYGHPFLPYNLVPSSIVGMPDYPVEDVTLENIEISYGGRAQKEIAHIPLEAVTSVPENVANYPEFSMFGELPSWGFYIRHARGIHFKNLLLKYVEDDFRPAIVTDDTRNISFEKLQIPTAKEKPVLFFNNSADLQLKEVSIPFTSKDAIRQAQYK